MSQKEVLFVRLVLHSIALTSCRSHRHMWLCYKVSTWLYANIVHSSSVAHLLECRHGGMKLVSVGVSLVRSAVRPGHLFSTIEELHALGRMVAKRWLP